MNESVPVEAEIAVLQNLQHEHIVRLHESFETQHRYVYTLALVTTGGLGQQMPTLKCHVGWIANSPDTIWPLSWPLAASCLRAYEGGDIQNQKPRHVSGKHRATYNASIGPISLWTGLPYTTTHSKECH